MSVNGQKHDELRRQLVQASDMLFQSGAMQLSRHGNMSARVGADRMLLSRAGSIGSMTVDDFVEVAFDGEVIGGDLPPGNREIVHMHTGVYRERPDVGAVIHTHSPHSTGFALANEPLPCAYEALLRFGVTDAIPVAGWAPRGSPESVANIVAQLRDYPTVPAVLLGNHGLLAFAADPVATARLVIIMEEAAQMTLAARRLGGEKPFPPGALEAERAHMERFGSLR
jgi:L-ribulose-5-phosphate 4-epimerase